MTIEDLGALQTKATHATAFQNLIDHHTTLQMQMITNPELNEAIRIATDDPSSLTPAQNRLSIMFRTQQMRSFYNAYQLFENGLIDAKALQTFDGNINRVANTEHFGVWCNREKQGYPTSSAMRSKACRLSACRCQDFSLAV